MQIDLFRYWPVWRRHLGRRLGRVLLHGGLAVCALIATALPILRPAAFVLDPPRHLFVLAVTAYGVAWNKTGILWLVAVVAGAVEYFVVNVKRYLEPHEPERTNALVEVGELQLRISHVSRAACGQAKVRDNQAKERLLRALGQILDGVDLLVANRMDTVGPGDIVTSNVMAALEPKAFDTQAWAQVDTALRPRMVYSEDGCDGDYVAWLRLIAQSHRSETAFELREIALRVHAHPRRIAPGAGLAFHYGRHYVENAEQDLRVVPVNDVDRIEWPQGASPKMQQEAANHFAAINSLRSFVSVPLVRDQNVVGILNINGSGYFLAGRAPSQLAMLRILVLPLLSDLADVLVSWRELEYGI